MVDIAPTTAKECHRRIGMLSYLKTIEKWSGSYSAEAGYMTPTRYRDELRNSVYTLVPAGHSPECFRLWEAIQQGSIPIVEHIKYEDEDAACRLPLTPFERSGAPIVYLDSWEALREFMLSLGSTKVRDARAASVRRGVRSRGRW